MIKPIIQTDPLKAFLADLDSGFEGKAKVFLIGETALVMEGWRPWTTQIEISAEVESGDGAKLEALAYQLAGVLNVPLLYESPAELIPLPEGYQDRAIPVDTFLGNSLTVYHFDLYSVAYRFIARGDEPDYHIVLMLLKKGLVTKDELDARLTALLPRFTSETIHQDPAEFRRKYKGLSQMWKAHRPLMNHRFSQF